MTYTHVQHMSEKTGKKPSAIMNMNSIHDHDSNCFITKLNDCKPTCPVLMNTLHFPPCVPSQKQAVMHVHNLRMTEQMNGLMASQHSSAAGSSQLIPAQICGG